LHGSHSPIVLDEARWEKFCFDVSKRTQVLNATTPRDSLVTGLVAVAGGWIGAEAGEAIVGAILARVGTAVAVEAGVVAVIKNITQTFSLYLLPGVRSICCSRQICLSNQPCNLL